MFIPKIEGRLEASEQRCKFWTKHQEISTSRIVNNVEKLR